MQGFSKMICFVSLCIYGQSIYAQVKPPLRYDQGTYSSEFIDTDTGLIINGYAYGICKNYSLIKGFLPRFRIMTSKPIATTPATIAKTKLITIHGNISYDYFYRSKIDTPINMENLQQHTERIWLEVLVKEKYPFKVGFTARQSNSPLFMDRVTANLNFDKYSYNKNIKQELLNRLPAIKWQQPDLKIIDAALHERLKRYETLRNWINGPEALQRMIEEKERLFYESEKNKMNLLSKPNIAMPVFKSIKLSNGKFLKVKTDSLIGNANEMPSLKIDTGFSYNFESKKKELDSLEKSISGLRRQSDSIKNRITQSISKVKQSIYKANGTRELDKIAIENGITEPKKEKLQNFLSNVKSFGIGRSIIDYTELTAQNVLLSGVNIEYNPSWYGAMAVGKIDYGFYNFFGNGIKQKNQYLLLGRIGWGDMEKRTVILTVFNGRKNNYAGFLAADSNNNTARLFGYSVETIIRKNENIFLSVEFAKSTKNKKTSAEPAVTKADNLFKYNDNTNTGLNIKGQTVIPETDTRLSGFFRKTGQQFQSFSLFTYNTNQQAWQVRADQSFLKRKVNLTAMLRQNDFTNPLTDKTFKTTTVFKTLQLNIKLPYWPVINAGYYPGSQFYIVDNNTIRENVYYVLNGSVLYAYRLKDIAMNSSLVYNHYFNQATDSGFVLYKGTCYMLSQVLHLKKLQVEGSYSYNGQPGLNYYTLDANGDYSLAKFFRIGAGVKYNHVKSGKDYWGESIRISADFKKLGALQLHYEKSYLPTIQQTLYPVEIGRVSWYKFF